MPYTGAFIFLFLIIHVFGFGIAKPEDVKISILVQDYLSGFFYSLFYIISFIALAIHLNHGFWSMLQTFGINHPRYNCLISILTIAVPVLFLVIFGGIVVGLLVGFLWEWICEHTQRAEASRQARELRRLQREVAKLKGEKHEGKDEVLAMLEQAG